MKINAFDASLPFAFFNNDHDKDMTATASAAPQDVVNVNSPRLLRDDEVDNVLQETIQGITNDGAAALSLHSGLSESRVFALLGL